MAAVESEAAADLVAPAEQEVQSHREKTQMRLSRKEFAKRKQKYTEFWASLSFSTISFCIVEPHLSRTNLKGHPGCSKPAPNLGPI
jgi:hypothetical protein